MAGGREPAHVKTDLRDNDLGRKFADPRDRGQEPDRDALAPDAALRKTMFPPVGRPGIVLGDGALAGLWRGRKKGDVLEIEVEWLGDEADIAAEAQAVARLRGCASALIARP